MMRLAQVLLGSAALIGLGGMEARQAQSPILFKDMAEDAGIAAPGTNSAGPALTDYDNDGDLDIYMNVEDVAEGVHNRLWENNGDGTFTDVSAERGVRNDGGLGRGVSWGDMDNDGDQDLLVATMPPSGMMRRPHVPPSLYKNLLIETGEPNFENITPTSRLIRLDLERDMKIGGLNNTSGGIEWVDYNNDSLLDVMWRSADYEADNELFKNNGDGTFTRVTEEAGVSMEGRVDEINSQGVSGWFDFDQDGHVDLLAPIEGAPNVLFHNNGDGTFTDVTKARQAPSGLAFLNPGNANGVCLGDVDNDGDVDAYFPLADQANRLVLNDLKDKGQATFTDVTLASGAGDSGGARGCTMADFDNDGYLDIYVNNGGISNTLINDVMEGFPPFIQFYIAWTPAENALLRNNGDGTFTDVTKGSGAESLGIGKGVASGDVNGDGFIDIVVANQTYYSLGKRVNIVQQDGLLINQGNDNNWLKVKLVGTKSNRNGYNARVIATAGDLVQTREIYSATGYNSQNEQTLTFGLGANDSLDSIEVIWQSGATQTLSGVEAGQTITITEGEG